MKTVKRTDNVEVKEMLKKLKKDVRLGLQASQKSISYYIKACNSMLQIATIQPVTKKSLIENLNQVFEKSSLSVSYIKRVRGTITNFFEGGRKYPDKIETVKIRLSNINSFKELEVLSKAFKKEGVTEAPQKSKEKSPKDKNKKVIINPIKGGQSIDRKKYYKIIENVIKVSDNKLDSVDDDIIINIFDECIKISKMLGGIEG